MTIPTFREVEDRVGQILRSRGGLGAILVDLTPLARIERRFGGAIYESLRSQIDPVMVEMRSRFRDGDLLARDEREGDRFLVFVDLGDRRKPDGQFTVADLSKLADRAEEAVAPRLARLIQTYTRERTSVLVGYGTIIYSPLESAERQILRLIDDAQKGSVLRSQLKRREERERLVELLFGYERNIWTVFQPIVDMGTRQVMAHEALARGPRGTDLQSPAAMFGLAERHGMVDELERACRRQCFKNWQSFGVLGRLFVNTVPATVRDTSFTGRGVLDYLGPTLSPRLVTLEITEREVIENLSLYREATHAFTEMGFTFAIDDLGAGYSGLETVATLGASYLKIDMGLVRDIHQKHVNRQIVRAILDMGQGVGASVIAEGIETEDEAKALIDLGVRFAQGYYFARPIDPSARPAEPKQ
jgi:EAL domain-containing protein (putative c-di-GMP-specific phosphodiesterase class I)